MNHRNGGVLLLATAALGLGMAMVAQARQEPQSASLEAREILAHYVVFEIDSAGRVEPLYHALVRMHAQARSILAAQAGPTTRLEHSVQWQLWRKGELVGSYRSALAPLRSELARVPSVDNRIVSVPVGEPEARAFVVRIPVDTGDGVRFGDAAAPQRFDLAELAGSASTLREAHVPQVRVPIGGPPGNRLDLLVFGDGYTSAQQAKFSGDTGLLRDVLFAKTPYMDYASFINWMPAFLASVQAGADHPPYLAGCTHAGCCADPAAQDDPLGGQFVDTAFDATFCYAQSHRTLVVDYGKVYATAAAYPDWDAILVVVNDPVYGGTGGGVATISMHPAAGEVLLHELGHSITGLADEYSTPYPGYPPCSDSGGSSPCEANVTNQAGAGLVKWRDWFASGNPIPTPPGVAGVGLFQGARYQSVGMYRPVDTQCEMQFLEKPFCPVCRQEYVRVLQLGGWGVPDGGIDLIEPGSESPAPDQQVVVSAGETRDFAVDLLWPDIGALDVQWWLDGVLVEDSGADRYSWQAPLVPGDHALELRVRDVSPYVSTPLPERSRTWMIRVVGGDVRVFRDGFE